MDLNKKCYVYKFIDKNNRCLYVGQTNNLSHRIGQHLSLKSGKFNKNLIKDIKRIEYIKVDNRVVARQFEIYYINKYKASLNRADKFKNVRLDRNDFYERKWKVYKEYLNDYETSPRCIKMGILMVYVAFICIIVMSLSAYF